MTVKRDPWSAFLRELTKRKVVQVGLAYGGISWLLIQVADTMVDAFDAPTWILKLLFVLIFLGFPVTLVLTWIFDLRPSGISVTSDEEDLSAEADSFRQPRDAAVLCVDIVGYMTLKKRHEGEAENLVHFCNATVKPIMKANAGVLIRSLGDSIVCAFSDELSALNCALAIQRKFKDSDTLSLRASLAFGNCVRDNEHLAGEAINESFRVEPIAAPGGIVVTDRFWHRLAERPELQATADQLHAVASATSHEACYVIPPDEIDNLSGIESILPSGPTEKAHFQLPVWGKAILGLSMLVFLGSGYYLYKDKFAELVAFETIPSLAIIPFANLTGDTGLEYLSDGLTDELINLIGRIRGLRVTSRTTAFSFKGKPVDADDIGSRLGVDYFLEGSVKKNRDRIRVAVQLFDTDSGRALWGHAYDLSLEEFFNTRKDIALKTLSQLDIPVDEVARTLVYDVPTQNESAMASYLQGQEILHKPKSFERLTLAEQYFKASLDMDPNFAEAAAGLCQTLLIRYQVSYSETDFRSAENRCQQVESRASNAVDVQLSLAEFYLETGEQKKTKSYLERVFEQDQYNARAHMLEADLLAKQQKFAQAKEHYRAAASLDPGNWEAYYRLGRFNLLRANYHEAVAAFRKATLLEPDSATPYANLGASYLFLYDFDNAAEAFEKANAIEPTRGALSNGGVIHYYLGNFEKAVALYRKALELTPDDYRIWGNLADAFYQMPGFRQEAASAYLKALSLCETAHAIHQDDFTILATMAWFKARIGRFDEARNDIQAALAGADKDPDIYFVAGLIAAEQGLRDEAISYLQASLDKGYASELILANPEIAADIKSSLSAPGI